MNTVDPTVSPADYQAVLTFLRGAAPDRRPVPPEKAGRAHDVNARYHQLRRLFRRARK